MQIMLDIIAIIGFVLSIYNFVLEIIKNKKKLIVSFNHVFSYSSGRNVVQIIHVSIINKSSSPICISRMSVNCCGKSGFFGEYRKKIFDYTSQTGNEIKSYKTWTSNAFPVKIESGGFFNGLVISSESTSVIFPNEICNVQLDTDKGKVVKNIFVINFSDSELLSQCREPD